MAVAPYLIADANSDPVAVSGKWRVVLPTDVTAAVLADFGSALPGGNFSIAANASPRQAGFNVTTVPNTTVTTDRSFDVEIYDVLPAGATLTVSKVRTKIIEDDASTGPAVIYGPQTVQTTPIIDGGANGYVIDTFLNQDFKIDLLSDDGTDLFPGYRIRNGSGTNSFTGFFLDDAGAEALNNVQNGVGGWTRNIHDQYGGPATGLPATITVKPDGELIVNIDGAVRKGQYEPTVYRPRNGYSRFLRVTVGGGQNKSVKVTSL